MPPEDRFDETGFFEDPNEAIDRGRKQVQVATRRFFRQGSMTQPKWIKLSGALYKGDTQHLHSSQIGGLASGKMRDPSPKCILVIGQLNQAVADKSFPQVLRPIWEGLKPMVDVNGNVIGPKELFMAAAGQLDLGLDVSRDIPDWAEGRVSSALGAYLRRRLIERGVDFIVAMPDLRDVAPSVEPLLMGRVVGGVQLLSDLTKLAQMVGETETELWCVCSEVIQDHAS